MDLWIRSQDRKRLVPNPNLYVVYSEQGQCAFVGDTLVVHIGKYVTEERALEVLDEICDTITKNKAFVLYSNIGDFTEMNKKKEVFQPVYIMPQE